MTDEEFVNSVIYFHEDKGDVTGFAGWNQQRCKELMPEFYHLWVTLVNTENTIKMVLEHYKDKYYVY